MLSVPQSALVTKVASLQTPEDNVLDGLQWNDPNAATQAIPRAATIEAEDVKRLQDTSNLNNPIFHVEQQKAFKRPYDISHVWDTEGSEELEATEFLVNTKADGEQYLQEEFGLNQVYNGNEVEDNIRFKQPLYTIPYHSLTMPPGTNIYFEKPSTLWDKKPVKPANIYLDNPLRPGQPGAPKDLMFDTQISVFNTDTGNNPVNKPVYLDRNPLYDERPEK